MDIQDFSSDVVVVGGGGAACRAAIEAAEKGLNCIMVDKGRPGRSGARHPVRSGVYRRLSEQGGEMKEIHLKPFLKTWFARAASSAIRISLRSSPLLLATEFWTWNVTV